MALRIAYRRVLVEQGDALSEADPWVNTEEQIRKQVEDRKELQGPTPVVDHTGVPRS